MKRLVILGLLLLGLWARPALAQEWAIDEFRSEISVNTDASISVNEYITVTFTSEKHGIFRTIPFRYQSDQGADVIVPIEIQSVERDDQTEPYQATTSGDEIQYKIGDPDRTLTGRHTYHIAYIAKTAVNFFNQHDELYWNATGTDWDVPLGVVTAHVDLPSQVMTGLQAKCFTGALGSTAQDCTANASDGLATFTAENQPLTIVFGWPKGVVTKPDNYDELRSGAGQTALEKLMGNPIVFLGINVAFPLVVIGWLIRRWMTHGRDPKGKGTVVAQYDPPPGLTPGEMGTMFDEHANHRDVVATIVDLAVRGYLTITEVATKKLIGTSKDFQLERQAKGEVAKLKSHEKKLMDGLFVGGDSVKLSELKGTFHDDVKAIQSDLYAQVRDQGFFVSNPSTVRIVYVSVGLVVAFISLFGFGLGIFGPFIAGLAIAAFGPFMPKRTDKGAEALWHAKGFKLFLEKAEKYRLQWQEKEHIFEQYLPYAMAFGVAEKWSKTFEGIQQAPPGWYHGAYGPNFNTLVLWSALNSFSTNTVRSFVPPAASGSSGFGGGGFSGGGFGGGGGGSW